MGMARNTAPNIIVSPANVFDLQFADLIPYPTVAGVITKVRRVERIVEYAVFVRAGLNDKDQQATENRNIASTINVSERL